MLFEDRLILLLNAKVYRQQRGTVGKEPPGVQQGVLQVVFPHIGLGERGVDKVIGGGVHPFQKVFGIELVIGLEAVNLCIFQLHVFQILGKVCLVIVPEHQLAGIAHKFRIQAVNDLF